MWGVIFTACVVFLFFFFSYRTCTIVHGNSMLLFSMASHHCAQFQVPVPAKFSCLHSFQLSRQFHFRARIRGKHATLTVFTWSDSRDLKGYQYTSACDTLLSLLYDSPGVVYCAIIHNTLLSALHFNKSPKHSLPHGSTVLTTRQVSEVVKRRSVPDSWTHNQASKATSELRSSLPQCETFDRPFLNV
jgi:hypothetical protein